MKGLKTLNKVYPAIAQTSVLLLVTWLSFSAGAAASIQLISASDPVFGPPAGGGGDSYLPVLSRDGRYVLFTSAADNLVALGTNRPLPSLNPAPLNVFLRDRVKQSTVLVSINLDGTGGGNGDSFPVGVSTNGRYALFESSASNLIAGDTNDTSDVFVRDLVTGSTILVNVATNGGFADNSSYNSVITPDGRYVAFTSAADNLVPDDTNAIPDVFVRDLVNNVTRLASVGARSWLGSTADIGSDLPVITPDGRVVAFYSTAADLVPGVQTYGSVFLRDFVSGTTTWVGGQALTKLQSLGPVTNAVSFNHALSEDGRFVAYQAVAYAKFSPSAILRFDSQSGQSEMVDTNAAVVAFGTSYEAVQDLAMTPDGRFVAYVANAIDSSGLTTSIRVWDANNQTSVLASGDLNDAVSAGDSADSPILDDTGRFVAFNASALDLVTNEVPGDFHLYLRDLQSGTTTLLDADTNGVGSPVDPVTSPSMSGDGRSVAFTCLDASLVPSDRNRAYDVFVRDVLAATTELVSAHDPTLPSLTPNGSSGITAFSLSSDAHFAAFWSQAYDVTADGDTSGFRNIYRRDLLTGTNLLVSVNTNGSPGDSISTDPAISADGRYVAFDSVADDLVSGDTNGAQDVFVRDLQTGTTVLASVNAAGTGPGNSDSFSPILTGGGQRVLFHSRAANLISGMPLGVENLFQRDLQNARTVALTTNGVTAAAMTPDGNFVAFITSTSRFTPGSDLLYLWNAQSSSIAFSRTGSAFASVAISSDGQRIAYTTNNSSGLRQLLAVDRTMNTNWVIASYRSASSSTLRFSGNGRFLVYVGTLGVVPGTNQVYLFDFQTSSNLLISHSADGSTLGNDDSDSADLSADGRFISYRSAASNLVQGDTNGVPDIFLYDQVNGTTTLVTSNLFGNASANNRSLNPVFSPDGKNIFFESWASDLVSDDFNNNVDVFALSLPGGSPIFSVTVLPDALAPANWLSWPAAPGKLFRAQFKNELTDPSWQDLTNTISIQGANASLKDSVLPGTHKFYRVVAY